MASPNNTDPLSTCEALLATIDTQPIDHSVQNELWRHATTDFRCTRRGRVSDGVMSGMSLTFPGPGSADNVTIAIDANETTSFVTLAVKTDLAQDLAQNVGQFHSLWDVTVGIVINKMVRFIMESLYAATPPAGAPAGLAAAANANTWLSPQRTDGTFQVGDLVCTLENSNICFTPESPVYFLLPRKIYFAVQNAALGGSNGGIIGYGRDPASGREMLRICGVSAALTDYCPSNHAYLVLMDGDRTAPQGTPGAAFIHPRRNEMTGLGGVDFSVGPVTVDPTTDLQTRLITYGYGLQLPLRSVKGLHNILWP
jgi:hypothetical protein